MAKRRITNKTTQAENKKYFLQGMYNQVVNQLAERGEPTLAYAFHRFLLAQEAKGNSQQTIAYYQRWYKRYCDYLDGAGAGISANTMAVKYFGDTEEQNQFINFLDTDNRQTINAYMRAYRAFGNYCFEQGLIDNFNCPIKEVEPPVKEVYTLKELQKLTVKPNIEHFEEFRTYVIITLVLATGARSNTILNLKIKDVDLEEGYINFNTTKAHKVVRVGLERKMRRELAEYIKYWRTSRYNEYGIEEEIPDTDYLFCNNFGEQFTRGGLATSLRRYNLKRGVNKTSIHLLRHTFAKNWITSGGDIISLAKVLTHSELEMVKRYSNLYGDDVKKEIEEHSTLSQLRTKSGKTLRSK